jgi:Esterase-like activity of phytase
VSSVVSEIAAVTETRFIVSERDQLFPGDPKSPSKLKRIYKIDLAGATELSDPEDGPRGRLVNGRTLEQLNDEELRSAGIVPVAKELVVDLLAMPGGYPHDKSEGLAVISDTLIAVSNDDDFGIVPDGKGGISEKRLPLEGDRVDVNRIYFIRLEKPLK